MALATSAGLTIEWRKNSRLKALGGFTGNLGISFSTSLVAAIMCGSMVTSDSVSFSSSLLSKGVRANRISPVELST